MPLGLMCFLVACRRGFSKSFVRGLGGVRSTAWFVATGLFPDRLRAVAACGTGVQEQAEGSKVKPENCHRNEVDLLQSFVIAQTSISGRNTKINWRKNGICATQAKRWLSCFIRRGCLSPSSEVV